MTEYRGVWNISLLILLHDLEEIDPSFCILFDTLLFSLRDSLKTLGTELPHHQHRVTQLT